MTTLRESDRLTRCYFCGNTSNPRQALVASDEHPNHREHAPARPCADAIDARGEPRLRPDGSARCGHAECSPDWTCPPLPDGWAACAQCYRARPIDDLLLAERRMNAYGTPAWFTVEAATSASRLICSDGCQEWMRLLRDRKHTAARKPDREEDSRQDQDTALWDEVPSDGSGVDRADLSALWAMKDGVTRKVIARGVEAGRLRFEEVPTRAGGVPRKVYWGIEA